MPVNVLDSDDPMVAEKRGLPSESLKSSKKAREIGSLLRGAISDTLY